MNDDLLFNAFSALRRRGFALGIRELLDALRAARQGGWEIESADDLRQLLRLLWCPSADAARELDEIWRDLSESKDAPDPSDLARENPLLPATLANPASSPEEQEWEVATDRRTRSQADVELTPVPFRAPETSPSAVDRVAMENTWPLSRRAMSYAWQYLRQPIADGPFTRLDVEATVENVARQGFFLTPVYRREDTNHAHLVVLVDQGGSMAPFHRFSRELVETARSTMALRHVDVYYFHNCPAGSLCLDPHLTRPLDLEKITPGWSESTSLLIVSDAGAARGHRRLPRIRETIDALNLLRRRTSLVAWLNPMLRERWADTSAQMISQFVPMYPMNPDGLSNAIDVIRGQTWRAAR